MLLNRIPSLLSVLILLALSACTFQLPGFEQPTAVVSETEPPFVAAPAPTSTPVPTALPAAADTAPAPAAAQPTAAPPSATPLPPATSAPQSADIQPTATQPAPTATPTATSTITFDPDTTYGDPKYQNPMEIANPREWAPPETDRLPDNRNIRLEFEGGELAVTGYRPGFSTWWFSYHTLSDAYIEMTFDTENCSGEDAYGFIFRGPPHRAGESYGYIVSFTCNGRLWVYRLDDVDPWDAEVLVDEDRSGAIDTGPDERNVIGVRAEGNQFTIFANDIQVAQVQDDVYEEGRVGVFVRAAGPDEYTYRLTDFAYWTLGVDE